MNVEVISLGCRLNLAESESLRSLLAGEGDLVVINSCAVTAEALRQTRQAIRRARRARPEARLLVTGCAAEIDRPAISAMPEVDGLIANGAKLDPRAWNVAPLPVHTGSVSAHTRAFIAAQTGCDHACSFCVIPQGRGPSRSRPIAEVVADISRQIDGVDLTAWGLDLSGTPRLGALVTAILRACPALPRLRLSSLDGVEIDEELLELLAVEARVMPHLHLSLQHGDDIILKRMKRRHLRRDAIDLVAGLRARRSDIAIGADLIAGFPTEDDAAHRANLSIVAELGIVHGHVFPYSARAQTPAARMPQTPLPVIRARAAELRAAVAGEHARWQQGLIGTPLVVLAERDGTGHAENFARVRLPIGAVPGILMTITPTHVYDGLLT
jgi:threonylcarbamoyladenosine tRNA methylthiotransferase MtaB